MNSQFGERIRTLREKQNLYLRQVAPLLEIDTSQLSKIGKGLATTQTGTDTHHCRNTQSQ